MDDLAKSHIHPQIRPDDEGGNRHNDDLDDDDDEENLHGAPV